ncbi:hypothetical protein SAMN06269117_1062 [Balnearium lithotrophicum]|uniref:Uncharacterized protein n=1 Tax=Balnearium lithotrophicum TaxID=223788 RepID=A0A521BLC2_9BACT|nr:hypothetical protein [Balnearium lithotrophicum]SMO47896.1 hypothetical protein SAMN06269117_1062 [Balnearium lithotrophicum]
MALVGLSGFSVYGFHIPVMALRLFELHLVIEPNHPMVHEEILLFVPIDCYSLNIYLHGKVENFHGSFLHNLMERIYDEKLENGVVNFTKTFLIATHTNNYDAYESKNYKSIKICYPIDNESLLTRNILIDGIKATIYLDLGIKVIDYGECIKIEVFRKNGKLIQAGIVAIRFSIVMSSPEKKEQYKIHIFTPETLGSMYALFPDEKKAISNSSILTLIHKEDGLKAIEEFLNESKTEIQNIVNSFSIREIEDEDKDVFIIVDKINESFEKLKGKVRNYFLKLKKEDPNILKPHSDIWLQVPEFATQCEPPKYAKTEKYSWDFAFNIKPANILVSRYFLDKTIAYHLYIANEHTNILLSPEEGGIVEEFNLRFKVEPNFLIVLTFPIYILTTFVLRILDSILKNLLQGWDIYSNVRRSLENFHKLNMVKYNIFLKEIYINAFNSQNLVTILLVLVSLMFTLASIIRGGTGGRLSYYEYLTNITTLIKDPVFTVPLILSSLSLAFIYLYSSYRNVKAKWE